MSVYKREGIWCIDNDYQGRRIREAVGKSKKLAERALAARQGDIVQGRFGVIQSKERFPFKRLTEEYLDYSKSYKQSYIQDRQHVRHLFVSFGKLYIDEITLLFIERHRQKRIQKAKPATINREMACLKHMFNMAIRWRYTEKNPVREIKFYKEEPVDLEILTGDEVQQLVDACDDSIKPIVITALHTGMRKSEILNLRWKHVDLELGIINVTKTKTKENRILPISSDLSLVLCEPRVNEYVFPNPVTKKPYVNIKKSFWAALKRAGLPRIRFHDLRHNFAIHLILAGEDLVTVKELLGHKTISTTMRYSHLSNEHKKSAVEKLSARYQEKDSSAKILSLDGHKSVTNEKNRKSNSS